MTINIVSYRIPIMSRQEGESNIIYEPTDLLGCSRNCPYKVLWSDRPCAKKFAEGKPECLQNIVGYNNQLLSENSGIKSTTAFQTEKGAVEWQMFQDIDGRKSTLYIRVKDGRAHQAIQNIR